MTVIEQLISVIHPISPKPNQAYLSLDLSEIPNSLEILAQLELEGYKVQVRLQKYASGLKTVAILRTEESVSDDVYVALTQEWIGLKQRFGDAVSLRRSVENKLPNNHVYPIQRTVHDWITPGTTVWTDTQGHLCPEMESPNPGETIIYVDYDLVSEDELIQPDVELAIDAMGYPAGSRWIGRNSLDVDKVVSYVGSFPHNEVSGHLEKLQQIVPAITLVCLTA